MAERKTKKEIEAFYPIHEFYMTILNSIPSVVYWINTECQLQGCNKAFVQLLGLDNLKDFKGSPYDQMKQVANWSKARSEQFKLDDMAVIFSGEAQFNKNESKVLDKQGNSLYFQSTRVPFYNGNKIAGLIVSLTEITANKAQEDQEQTNPQLNKIPLSELENGHLPTVLMIEDNLVAQCVEKALLTSLHCEVDIAATEDSALKLFNPGKYDLVLMDIGLENTSGYVVAKKLRQMEQNTQHHVPIIALTSFDADVVKEDCKQYFMEGAITKPLTSEQAEQIIKHYVYHLDIPISGLKNS